MSKQRHLAVDVCSRGMQGVWGGHGFVRSERLWRSCLGDAIGSEHEGRIEGRHISEGSGSRLRRWSREIPATVERGGLSEYILLYIRRSSKILHLLDKDQC